MDELLARALPRTAGLRRGERAAIGATFGLLGALLAATAVNAAGVGSVAVEHFMRDDVSSAIYVLVAALVWLRTARVPHRRIAWAIFAVGISSYGLGNIVWSFWIGKLPNPPIPSISDAMWLAFYPLAAIGLVGLSINRGYRRPAISMWLDGIVAGAGLAAVGTAIVFDPVLAATSGLHQVAVDVEMAYPLGDLLLVGAVVGVIAMRGWRPDRGWVALGLGFLVLTVADFLYAAGVQAGISLPSAFSNLVYVTSVALMAFSAWQQAPVCPEPKLTSWSVITLPTIFMLTGLAVLVGDHFQSVNGLSYGLAATTMVAAAGRMALAFRDVRGLSEARRLAATDDLTSLPNRRQFMGLVDEAIAGVDGHGGALAVLMLDLDNFKQLNDTLGHHAGDALLQMIGPRLDKALSGMHTVGRLGGDEFAVLVSPAASEERVRHIAEQMLSALRRPFTVHGLALRVTGSVGISSYPGSADVAALMRHADIAMYEAKAARSGYEFYAHERDTNSLERLALAGELEAGLRDGEIIAHFQPKALARGGRIVGVEALVRWQRADGRLIGPAEFVSAAEHAGLSRALTARVLDLSLREVARWRADGHDIQVAVNTTVADLLDAAFPREVAAALGRHALPAEALILEITENAVLADPDRIVRTLGALRELGIELSLDDFGTGYSSLTHLKDFPVAEMKIDRSFVARMCSDVTDSAIVFAMIQLARKLGIRVVAEGVEDTETWETLRSLDCELIQGYLISRPVPAGEMTALLEAQRDPVPGRPVPLAAPRA